MIALIQGLQTQKNSEKWVKYLVEKIQPQDHTSFTKGKNKEIKMKSDLPKSIQLKNLSEVPICLVLTTKYGKDKNFKYFSLGLINQFG